MKGSWQVAEGLQGLQLVGHRTKAEEELLCDGLLSLVAET